MTLDGMHHANEPTIYDERAFDDYFGTPWLTGTRRRRARGSVEPRPGRR
jgi:hypothetical protein